MIAVGLELAIKYTLVVAIRPSLSTTVSVILCSPDERITEGD